jgi:hypothetical protein
VRYRFRIDTDPKQSTLSPAVVDQRERAPAPMLRMPLPVPVNGHWYELWPLSNPCPSMIVAESRFPLFGS